MNQIPLTLHFSSYHYFSEKQLRRAIHAPVSTTWFSFTSQLPLIVLLFLLLISDLTLPPAFQFSEFIFCDLSAAFDMVSAALYLSFLHITILDFSPTLLLILLGRTLFFHQILNVEDMWSFVFHSLILSIYILQIILFSSLCLKIKAEILPLNKGS